MFSVPSRYLDFDGASLPIQTDVSGINDTTTWKIWFKVKPQLSGDFRGHLQTCFGGAGAGCWKNSDVADDDWSFNDRGGFRYLYVSVGSILQDNCCVRNPTGKNCGGVFTGGTETKHGTRPGRGTMAVLLSVADWPEIWQGTRCEWEWQKALQNQTDHSLFQYEMSLKGGLISYWNRLHLAVYPPLAYASYHNLFGAIELTILSL